MTSCESSMVLGLSRERLVSHRTWLVKMVGCHLAGSYQKPADIALNTVNTVLETKPRELV